MSAEEIFEAAVQHRDRDEYKEALDLLLSVKDQLSYSASYLAVLAHMHWELDQLEEAIEVFRCAAKIAPHSETVSVSLFHCLWESDDIDAAFDEMRRYLSKWKSEEYTRLLADINAPDE